MFSDVRLPPFVWIVAVLLCALCGCRRAQESVPRTDQVDVFWGVGATQRYNGPAVSKNLPRIDTSWYNVREMNGATHPGATIPFGALTVNVSGLKEYRKGYPSGYYKDRFYGLSHFHASGTGTIRWYYNYVLFSPQNGEPIFDPPEQRIVRESGAPGYYRCTLNSGITAEATVGQHSAMHRFTYPDTENNFLVVDVTHYLKALDTVRVIPSRLPEALRITIRSDKSVGGYVLMDGLPLYFYLELDEEPVETGIFAHGENMQEMVELDIQQHVEHAGLYFSFDKLPEKTLTTRIGFSFAGEEEARKHLYEDFAAWDLEAEALRARQRWEAHLSRFDVRGGDPVKRRLFYSALYRSSMKPVLFTGEHPFWNSDTFVSDLATCWDVYVCQLPFVFTFYPETGQKIARFFLESYRQFDVFPPAYLMKAGLPWVFSKQASALGNMVLLDAMNRGIDVGDRQEVFDVMKACVNDKRGKLFQQGRVLAPSPTHNVDYAYATFCAARLAAQLGMQDEADTLMQHAGLWKAVYDSIGVLIHTDEMVATERYPRQHFNFYEGNRWNHNFKTWHDMSGLIELQGGKDPFMRNLDWYFNFIPNETTFQFQGLNNEVDYTVPYAYLYAGRPDRTQQVVRVAMEYRFNPGRGGLPGNDDSGAMSSWYVWNAIGLFPVVAQEIFLIGSPLFDEVVLQSGEQIFTVKAVGNSNNNIYVQSAKLNGMSLERPFISHEEFRRGGELLLNMGPKPSAWGVEQLPPSYR